MSIFEATPGVGGWSAENSPRFEPFFGSSKQLPALIFNIAINGDGLSRRGFAGAP